MADKEKPPFNANLVFEGGTLLSIQIKKPKENADGQEIEASKTVLAFAFETERVERYFGVLSRLLRRDRPVTAGLAFTEQLELPKAEQNGHGKETTGLEPIDVGGSKKKGKQREHASANK